jgi:hypothetical protein
MIGIHLELVQSRPHINNLRFKILWYMGRFYNDRGMPSLLGNDVVNILADNNKEYIVITRF